METICACRRKNCQIKMAIDEMGGTLAFTDRVGKETIMYLNPNVAISGIKMFQSYLKYKAGIVD